MKKICMTMLICVLVAASAVSVMAGAHCKRERRIDCPYECPSECASECRREERHSECATECVYNSECPNKENCPYDGNCPRDGECYREKPQRLDKKNGTGVGRGNAHHRRGRHCK